MSYLLAVHWVWSILALVLGAAVGWATFKQGDDRSFRGWENWAAVLFIVSLTAALLALLPGRAAFWLETALLLVAIYFIGCASGWLVRHFWTAAEIGAPQLATAGKVAAPAPPPAAPARVSPAAARPRTPAPAAHPGTKPPGLVAPRNGAGDDLRQIMGIGKKTEASLHALGIFHFDQIAAWTPEEAAYVGHHLGFPGRVEQKHWIEQARLLAAAPATTSHPVSAASAHDRTPENTE